MDFVALNFWSDLGDVMVRFVTESGFAAFFMGTGWKNLIMIAVACVCLYLAIGKQYEPLLLAGPDGEIVWRDLLGEVWTGCFAVTSRCKDPAAALKWVDALYSEEGALLAYAGLEGEDYTFGSNGKWAFLLPGGRTMIDICEDSVIYTGETTPGLYPASFIFSVDSEADQHVFAASERVRAVSKRVTQPYALGRKEQARAQELAAVLGEMVDSGIARFVTGELELTDDSYAAWIADMQAAGSGELAALFAQAE